MIRSIVVFPDGDVVRHHIGTGRVAARAHRDRDEQLLGTQIAHATGASSPVSALVIGVIGAPLRRREVSLPRRTHDAQADLGLTGPAVDLAAVTDATECEHAAATAAENEPKIVQVPTPSDALLALSCVIGDGPPVCVPTRQGRPRASTSRPSAFLCRR